MSQRDLRPLRDCGDRSAAPEHHRHGERLAKRWIVSRECCGPRSIVLGSRGGIWGPSRASLLHKAKQCQQAGIAVADAGASDERHLLWTAGHQNRRRHR